MVKVHIKKGDESQFLYYTTVTIRIDELLKGLMSIYNGRQRIERICIEMEKLANHGITLPLNLWYLSEDQINVLKVKDDWSESCRPIGGPVVREDSSGRRNGQAPVKKMAEILKAAIREAREVVSQEKVTRGDCLTVAQVDGALRTLHGALMIVYPMGLPPHDPIRAELENYRLPAHSQVLQEEEISEERAVLCCAGVELKRGKKLTEMIVCDEHSIVVCDICEDKYFAESFRKRKFHGCCGSGLKDLYNQPAEKILRSVLKEDEEDLVDIGGAVPGMKVNKCVPTCSCLPLQLLKKIPVRQLVSARDHVRAVDCEFADHKLASVAVTDGTGQLILRLFARNDGRVKEGLWNKCGHVGPVELQISTEEINKQVQRCVQDKLVVGHSVECDIRALGIDVPKEKIRDTFLFLSWKAQSFPESLEMWRQNSTLKAILARYGFTIQSGVHCPVQDSCAALLLYMLHKEEMDRECPGLPGYDETMEARRMSKTGIMRRLINVIWSKIKPRLPIFSTLSITTPVNVADH